jgi:hypothetical protein
MRVVWSHAIELENRVDKQRRRGGTVVGGGGGVRGGARLRTGGCYAVCIYSTVRGTVGHQVSDAKVYDNPNPQDHHGAGGDSRAISRTIHFCATEKGR